MPLFASIADYLRGHAEELGNRILETYPPLHAIDDLPSSMISKLLRKPYPAQTLAIMGLVRRWQGCSQTRRFRRGTGSDGRGLPFLLLTPDQMNRLVRDFSESARKVATPPHSRPPTSSDSLMPITSRDISQAIIRTPKSRAREIIFSSELTFFSFIMERSILAPTPK